MKLSIIKSLAHTFIFLFVLIGVQAVQANTGKAFSIKGKVTVNGETMTLATELKQGDLIQTEAGSSVKVIMKDGSVLDIDASTVFRIEEYAYSEAAPEENKGTFNLFTGAFRYVSGLIAKKNPAKVALKAGTATIGIRGSFTQIKTGASGFQTTTNDPADVARSNAASTKKLAAFKAANDSRLKGDISIDEYIAQIMEAAKQDYNSYSENNTVAVEMAIGSAELKIPNADGTFTTLNISKGTTGAINVSTGATSTSPSSNPVAAAAAAMAAVPADADAAALALAGLSTSEKALAISVLINNASTMTPPATTATITAAVGNAVKADKSLAAAAAYVASALSPANKAAFKTAITAAAPDQANAIEAAGEAGSKLGNAPVIKTEFNLRVNADTGDATVTVDGEDVVITNTNAGGTPLTTEQIQEAINSLSSP